MRPLTTSEYQLLTKHNDAFTLIKHGILGNGIDDLVPLYEDIIGEPLQKQCTDCKKDMMVTLSILKKKYEEGSEPVKMKFPKQKQNGSTKA